MEVTLGERSRRQTVGNCAPLHNDTPHSISLEQQLQIFSATAAPSLLCYGNSSSPMVSQVGGKENPKWLLGQQAR